MTIIQRSRGHFVAEVEPGLWRLAFHFPASVNCWLLQDEDGLTLVDAAQPWNAATILSAVEAIGQPLRRIVITHAHPDHAGAAAELMEKTGATVFAHEEEVAFLEGRGCMADLPGFWLCRGVLKTGKRLGVLDPPVIKRVQPVSDGESIGALEVLHTPGHTPGSISLWSSKQKAIFCGDNIATSFNRLHLGLPWFNLDARTRNQSIRKYELLPAQMLLTGHGPVHRSENMIKDVLKLLPAR